MSDGLLIAVISALINGAVTWGVVTTKLAWMRADIDELKEWRKHVERRA